MTRKLQALLEELGQEEENLNYQLFGNLSDLNPRELVQFQDAWSGYSLARQRELTRALVEQAEINIEYDFRNIFAWTIDDLDGEIRVLSIEGLWEDQRPQLAAEFRKLLHNDPDVEVRAAAAVALGRFIYWGELDQVDSKLAKDASALLWDRLHQPGEDISVRARALEGLAYSSDPGVTRMIESNYHDADLAMRCSALYAMGRSADPRWIRYLIPELSQHEPELRLESARALGELEARAAVPYITTMIAAERDAEVRLVAITTLGQIGGNDAKRALEALTESDDEAIVDAAENAMEELLASEGSTYELINEVLGIEEEANDADTDSDFYEDPLEAELRQLLDERDEWME